MDQFAAVAAAHFLALLIPGVDFFLIVRTALAHGWHSASGACFGIATANGVFISAAFGGLSLVSNPTVLTVVRLAGGTFLVYVGIAFLRAKIALGAESEPTAVRSGWGRSFGLGLLSALLNPKNALFYASLAASISGSSPRELALYGAWMFSIVLAWDLFVALSLGSRRALKHLSRGLPWITKVAGVVVTIFGLGMLVSLIA